MGLNRTHNENNKKKKLTMRNKQEPARATGMATEVSLSIGPFRWVCLWMLWNNRCLSMSCSLGLKGSSATILQYHALQKIKTLNLLISLRIFYGLHEQAFNNFISQILTGDISIIFYQYKKIWPFFASSITIWALPKHNLCLLMMLNDSEFAVSTIF